MSATVVELVEAAVPILERMALAFQRLDSANEKQRIATANRLGAVQTKMDAIVDRVVDQFDMFASDVESLSLQPDELAQSSSTIRQVAPPVRGGAATNRPKTLRSEKTPRVVIRGSTSRGKPHPDVKPLSKRTANAL